MIGAAIAFFAASGIVLREHGTSAAFKKITIAAGFCLGWLLYDIIKRGAA